MSGQRERRIQELRRRRSGGCSPRPPQRAGEALQIGLGQQPTFQRCGGTIPVVGTMKNVLGIDTLLVGFGLPDDRVHAPNEKFDLAALHNGARTAAAMYDQLSKL